MSAEEGPRLPLNLTFPFMARLWQNKPSYEPKKEKTGIQLD